MIYLTFDSNIWIYCLDESWQIENHLDYLEPWIENGQVRLLLPKMVINEWEKHENKQVEERQKKLRDFFSMAEEILPSAFYTEFKEPAVQRSIIAAQLNRAKSLIYGSDVIPEYPEVNERIILDGIAKKAPMQKKSSVADALIVFSLIQYSKLNPGNHYFFVSNNTEDFYDKTSSPKEIHHDLKPEFDSNNIKAFTNLDHLIFFLTTTYGLKIDENVSLKKRERIRNKIKERVYNPEYDKLTESGETSYIQNLDTINFILKERIPTKEQVIFVLALADSDPSFERDFYRRLDKISWFEILRRKGVYNPINNPVPIQEKESFSIPFWELLTYLEKISIQIANGQHHEVIRDILSIIKSVSQKPVKNTNTWCVFTKILTNIPNEKIPIEILDFIPIWLKESFDTAILSLELCQKLLPKFLSSEPSKEDILKAELLLRHLFKIEIFEVSNQDSYGVYSEKYYSIVYLYYLQDSLIENKLTEKISAYCSNHVITGLADNIKKLKSPKGINFSLKLNNNAYDVKAKLETENIILDIFDSKNPELKIGHSLIENFESMSVEQIRKAVIKSLKGFGLEYESNQDNTLNLNMLMNAITNGTYYSIIDNAISKLDDPYYGSENLIDVFSLIFRDLVNQRIKQNEQEGILLLKTLSVHSYYHFPFFKRIVLYVIGENWLVCKKLFWEIVEDNDPMHIFSNSIFEKDLYEMLNKNQEFFCDKEIEGLEKIIGNGPQDERDDRDTAYENYWRLRWFSALRNISPFSNYYQILSESENITNEYYENLNGITVRTPSVSNNVSDILQKSNQEIIDLIKKHSIDNIDGSTIEDLSNLFMTVVKRQPEKISDEIELFKDIPYAFAIDIADGIREAWKDKKLFDWERVLKFFKDYISSEKYLSGQLRSNSDGWGPNQAWVTGSIGQLLTEGMQSDTNAFDLSLLPIAKDILKILIPRLKASDDFLKTYMDYPTYTLNSVAGKIIRALLDYSLRRARNVEPLRDIVKWEEDIKILLEETFKKGILDGYILTGMYFHQFYYLDKDWIAKRVKENFQLEDNYWLAFFSGFAFTNPPFNKDLYELFYPHYERAIKSNIHYNSHYNHGIIQHIVAFYFWDFEDLQSEGLLMLLIKVRDHDNMVKLINFLWQQESSLKNLRLTKADSIELKILNIWELLAANYQDAKSEEEHKVLSALSNLLIFIPELNDRYTNLVLQSCESIEKHFQTHYLIENLITLKERGDQSETARHIATILNAIEFKSYFSSTDDNDIKELVTFLYQNGQKAQADDFCNKMTRKGNDFLVEIYNQNK
jgi:hypothetical protein